MNNEKLSVCPKCGTEVMEGAEFCTECGQLLREQENNNEVINEDYNDMPVKKETESSVQTSFNSQVQENVGLQNNSGNNSNVAEMNYFKYILNVLLKPFKAFKDEEKNLMDIKNTGIIGLILVLGLTLIKLLTTMINVVRVKSLWTGEVEWVWENLEKVKYFKIIFQNILIYAGVIVAIAGLYYMASLVLKKEIKFQKLLAISVTSFIPLAILIGVVAPVAGMIYSMLGTGISIIGLIYSIIILIELINNEVEIEDKNTKIYLHTICLSILILIMLFILYRSTVSVINNEINSIIDYLG